MESAMTSQEPIHPAIERLLVREVLEKYLASLDDKDWDGIAGCFTDDAVSHYNDEPDALHGGKGVADWLHRMVAYNATDHSLSNVRIEVTGDTAVAHSLVIATLHQGTWPTLLGDLKWDAAGAPDGSFSLIQWQGGKLVPVFPSATAQATPLYPKPNWGG